MKNKIFRKNKLFEFYGAGFTGPSGSSGSMSSSGQPYCEYRILDLNSNLSQKGNTAKIKKEIPITLGVQVYGICTEDNKKHYGPIKRFYITPDSQDISIIYILDQNSEIVPLDPKTVKIKKNYYNKNNNINYSDFSFINNELGYDIRSVDWNLFSQGKD